MDNIWEKERVLWWQKEHLDTAVICLGMFQKSGDERFKDHAEFFMNLANDFKREFENL